MILGRYPVGVVYPADGARIITLSLQTSTKTETLSWAATAGTIANQAGPTGGTDPPYAASADWQVPSSAAVVTITCTSSAGDSVSWVCEVREPADILTAPPVLTGPATGAAGGQIGPYTLTYAAPWYAVGGPLVVAPISTVAGDRFQASSGGADVGAVTIAGGVATVQFWLRPAGVGPRRLSVACSWPHGPGVPGTWLDVTVS